jgi:hypothetical protein
LTRTARGSELVGTPVMLPLYGKDRCRESGERVVLLSAIPKGWTARTPASGTHAEYPGTTVEWADRMFEVVEAVPVGEGVRYVLLPWREDHVIRTLDQYDDVAEHRRIDDFAKAQKQRRASIAARITGMLLGYLPAPVQNRLQKELGLYPARMTSLSCIPPLVLLGFCILDAVDAYMKGRAPYMPGAITMIAALLVVESAVRFFVAMSQNRGMGSFLGLIGYSVYWALSPNRAALASPFDEPGESTTFTLPPPPEVAAADRLEMLSTFLALLPVADQQMLAERTNYDYRRHAAGLATGILFFAILGVFSMFGRVGSSAGATVSFLAAFVVAVEQVLRLVQLRTGPAASMFGFVVRPFVRNFLEEARRAVKVDAQPSMTARN